VFLKKVYKVNLLLAFLIAFFSSSIFSSYAFSSTVRNVNSSKSLVTINLNGNTYKNGDELCFYTAKDSKIECGSVTGVRSKTATIKLTSKKNIRKIRRGMKVKLATDSENKPTSTANTTTAAKKKEGFSLWMSWSPAIMSPSIFNSVGYLAPPTETPTTLWDADAAVTSSLLGAAIQTGFPVGSLSIMPGFRYRMFVPSRVDTDYFPKRLNPFVSSVTTGSALGLFTDLRFLNVTMGSWFSFFSTGGLDIEMSSLNFKSTKKDDTGATPESAIASAKSSLTVISLRTGAGLNIIPFRPFGASLGFNLILPVTEVGKKFSGSIEDTETKGLADPGGDLKTAIGHKKNKFAADAHFSLLFVF